MSKLIHSPGTEAPLPELADSLADLFAQRGQERYSGEAVTQLQHALQTATLAEAAGASTALVAAALLHDIGHLLHDLGPSPSLAGIDDSHQARGAVFLRQWFGDEVVLPIALHVNAKRYLCRALPGYQAALSADSQRSLALQGGVFSSEQAEAFLAQPYAADAVALRQWDDLAKNPDLKTPPLAYFLSKYASGPINPCRCNSQFCSTTHPPKEV